MKILDEHRATARDLTQINFVLSLGLVFRRTILKVKYPYKTLRIFDVDIRRL